MSDKQMTVVTPPEFARTYNTPSYEDPWGCVEDYQRVLEYTAAHPDTGSTAVASALDLPRSRIRPWMNGSRPDVVRGIQAAEARGWLPLTYETDTFAPLNQLVAWLYSGGALITSGAEIYPTFSLNTSSERDRFETLATQLDLDIRYVHEDTDSRATEARLTEDGSVLGRLFLTVGVPTGRKNPDAAISLPQYLEDAPASARADFVRSYVLNRGQWHAGKETVTLREERARGYLRDLAALIEDVTGGAVSVAGENIIISADAARNLP